MTLEQVNRIIVGIKKDFNRLAKEQKLSFLFVYGAGHGVADQQQYMVLNTASGNVFPIEQNCRQIC